MFPPMTRRTALKAAAGCMAATAVTLAPSEADARVTARRDRIRLADRRPRLVDSLLSEGVPCVFGIPGAQENELWDTMKAEGLGYLLVTHEFSAACMADGVARSTGKPGVICVVPGPGLTNSLTASARLCSTACRWSASSATWPAATNTSRFRYMSCPQVGLLQQVTKRVFPVSTSPTFQARFGRRFSCAQRRTGAGRRRDPVQAANRIASSSTAAGRAAPQCR